MKDEDKQKDENLTKNNRMPTHNLVRVLKKCMLKTPRALG